MLKKILGHIIRIFYFSPAEARGFVVVLGGLLMLLIVWCVEEWYFSSNRPSLALPSQQLDSVVLVLETQKSQKNYIQEDLTSVNINPSPFNPNTASVAELQAVGIPHFLAERIAKYRSKGGRFKKKEDLQRIYDFPARLYQQLETYIQLPASEEPLVSNRPQFTERFNEADNQPFKSESNTPKLPRLSKFDINIADTSTLKQINGIGSGYAKRIVKFRDALGGFYDAEQVRETFGLPPETADELLKYAILKSAVRKININNASMEQLDTHPYINKTQAKVIVAYREQHGAFKSAEDLKNIKVLDTATIEKLIAYLQFD